ncbi:MAG: DNA polymerase III subunit delta [Chloroflexi bacterium]|nr:DNA polymerase III subunit delta [Chloroflexota bacterium]
MADSPPRLYLFHGSDEYSSHLELKRFKTKLGDAAIVALNTTVLEGMRVAPQDLVAACNAMPFLSDRRLVVVTGLAPRLAPPKPASRENAARLKKTPADQSLSSFLTAFLPDLPDWTRLVFLEEEPLKADHPLVRLVQDNHGYIKEFPLRKEAELTPWILDQVKERGGRITPQAAAALGAFVGPNLRLLTQEIDKLLTAVGGARPVEVEDVEAMVSYAREVDVFSLVDALAYRQGTKALRTLHRLLEEGEHPMALLIMITRHFRQLLQVKELSAKGASPDQIAETLRMHPFVAKKSAEQARSFSLEQLEGILRHLLATDATIKTGRMSELLSLDLLVAELTAP